MRYRDLARRLRKLGCECVRDGSGSHRIWWNPANARYITIPDWGPKDIKPGTLRRILNDLDVERSQFGPIK
jgi:predicted RNA binding protein YcfA (HicA-like mRNA interferase family)